MNKASDPNKLTLCLQVTLTVEGYTPQQAMNTTQRVLANHFGATSQVSTSIVWREAPKEKGTDEEQSKAHTPPTPKPALEPRRGDPAMRHSQQIIGYRCSICKGAVFQTVYGPTCMNNHRGTEEAGIPDPH